MPMNQNQLSKLRAFLLEHMGLLYTEKQDVELCSKIDYASKGFDFENTEKFVEWLLMQNLDASQTKKLATYLTIGETYFFRERKALDYLENNYLPMLIAKRRHTNKTLNIWSAGCSSGEEPFTIAIILHRLLPDIKNWDIRILGTDINLKFLEKAQNGVYSKWSFRGMSETVMDKYFEKINENKYRLKPFISDMVNFSYLNLASPPYFPASNKLDLFDVILCRNVLIYFSQEGIKTATKSFYNKLKNEGVLLLSAVETSNLVCEDFNRIPHQGIMVYEKNSEKNSKPDRKIPKTNYIHSFKQFQKPDFKDILKKKLNSKTEKKVENESVEDNDFKYEKLLKNYQTGNIEEAEQKLIKIIDNAKNVAPKYYLLLARIRANKGSLDIAEKLCNKAIQIDKVNTAAYYLLANVYNEQGKIQDAISSINRTLFLDPNFAMAHFLLGNIAKNDLNYKASTKHYKNALKSLSKLENDKIVPGSDGLTAGGLSKMIDSVLNLNSKVLMT
jgi:chemotaxis protein methyltransferase CheR